MQSGKESNILVVKLDDGENLHASLEQVLAQNSIKSAVVMGGIGMVADFKIGYYDGKDYVTKEVAEPHELVSLSGSVAHGGGGKLLLHLHCAVADKEHRLLGGHLFQARVRFLNEIYLMRLLDIELGRRKSEKSGLMELEIHKASDTRLTHVAATKHRSGSLELDVD